MRDQQREIDYRSDQCASAEFRPRQRVRDRRPAQGREKCRYGRRYEGCFQSRNHVVIAQRASNPCTTQYDEKYYGDGKKQQQHRTQCPRADVRDRYSGRPGAHWRVTARAVAARMSLAASDSQWGAPNPGSQAGASVMRA